MTADEMFQKLGYAVAKNECSHPCYINKEGEELEICAFGFGVTKYKPDYVYGCRYLPFSIEECKAVAKKLEEMGW